MKSDIQHIFKHISIQVLYKHFIEGAMPCSYCLFRGVVHPENEGNAYMILERSLRCVIWTILVYNWIWISIIIPSQGQQVCSPDLGWWCSGSPCPSSPASRSAGWRRTRWGWWTPGKGCRLRCWSTDWTPWWRPQCLTPQYHQCWSHAPHTSPCR